MSCETVTGISIRSSVYGSIPPFFSWGNKSSYCNLVLDGVHHRQMHLDEFWHFFPCTLSTGACMGVRPCLFSSPSPHTHHLPLQGNSSSLTRLMGAARRLMSSAWREPVTPLLHPSLSPTFVCLWKQMLLLLSSPPPGALCSIVFQREGQEGRKRGEGPGRQNKIMNHVWPLLQNIFTAEPEPWQSALERRASDRGKQSK